MINPAQEYETTRWVYCIFFASFPIITYNALRDMRMTAHEWGSTRCILRGMLSFAVDSGYIEINYLKDMDFARSQFRAPVRKSKDTQVFSESECRNLIKWCLAQYRENGDVIYLYPPLALCIGVRVAEAAALTWDCLSVDQLIIRQEERKDRYSGELTVVPHTKTYRDRTLDLSADAIHLLDMIRRADKSDIWIFARDGKRMTSRQANYVLEKFAKSFGLSIKASHCLRRTLGSKLKEAGMSSMEGSEYLGNTVEVFERYYCFDTRSDGHKKAVVNAIQVLKDVV